MVFKGSAVALVTPFDENGKVNFDKIKELVEYHIENGTDAIVACGTTGEASTMNDEEHLAAIKAIIDAVDKRRKINLHLSWKAIIFIQFFTN